MTSRSSHDTSSTSNEVPVPSIYSNHSLGSPRSPNNNNKNSNNNQDRTRSPNPNIVIKNNNDVEDTNTAQRKGNQQQLHHHAVLVSTPSENDNSGGASVAGRNAAYVAKQQQQQSNLNTLQSSNNNGNNSRNHSRKTSSNNPETSQQQQHHRNLGDHSLITGGGADAISFDRDDDSLTREEDDGFDDDDITVTATNLSTAPPIVRPGVNQCPHGTLQASETSHGGGRRISASGGGVRSPAGATQQIMFGPNRSAMSMLKALRFSPFVAVNTRRNNHLTHNNNNNGNNNNDDDDESARSDDFYRAGDPGRVPTTPWEFFTPSMTQYYSVIGYIFAIVMFSCSIASIVARHKTKPNTPIECDYRLDQSLAWLAGLMMPEAIFVPVWSAIFLQHVYPPLYQASRVPLERTFRHYGHFIAFSSFLAVLTVAIFGSSLYALSVAKSWDFVEHEACGYSFSALRTIAIFGISSIGFIAVAHFIHWAYLNKKLDEIRGVVRPIPADN